MADQTNIDSKPDSAKPADTATSAPRSDTVKTEVKAAPAKLEAVKAEASKAPKVRAKRATKPKRRVRRATADVVAAVKKTNKRAVNSARRAKATPATAAKIERNDTMTNDFTPLFAGFQLPGADRFQSLFADAGSRSQQFAAKGQKAAESFTELGKANVEALVEAGRIAVTGAKTIGQDALASGRENLEQASQSLRTLADAESPTEFFQLQSDLVRSSFDRLVSDSSKLTEQLVKLAGEAIQPISNRASVNAERVNELMA